MTETTWRELEMNGGQVGGGPRDWRLVLPPIGDGYADAQIDDYGGLRRRDYPHRPGTTFSLRARFSHPAGELRGTAGFGFWNAPFGDPTVPWPWLPQAAWFFYASEPGDLPLAPHSPGRGWFAATLDATTARALAWAPLAPPVLLLNQVTAVRRRLWPAVRRSLGISYVQLDHEMTAWHDYELAWQPHGCFFRVDGMPVLQTPFSPAGPLGFVAWIDNQYLVATPTGRFGWGVLTTTQEQWLAIHELELEATVQASSRRFTLLEAIIAPD